MYMGTVMFKINFIFPKFFHFQSFIKIIMRIGIQRKPSYRGSHKCSFTPILHIFVAVLLAIVHPINADQWELHHQQLLTFPVDIVALHLMQGDVVNASMSWSNSYINVNFKFGILSQDGYSYDSILRYYSSSSMPQVMNPYTITSEQTYYFLPYVYNAEADFQIRFEISVNGNLTINHTVYIQGSYRPVQLNNLCRIKLEVIDSTPNTIYHFAHPSAQLSHSFFTNSYQESFIVNLEKSNAWSLKISRPKPTSVYSVSNLLIKIYKEVSRSYVGTDNSICQINCSQIEHSIFTVSNKYACFCEEGYFWDPYHMLCRIKCDGQAQYYTDGLDPYSCACFSGYLWDGAKCIFDCSSIQSTITYDGENEGENQCFCKDPYIWDKYGKVCYQPQGSIRSKAAIIMIFQVLAIAVLFLLIVFFCFKFKYLLTRKSNIERSLLQIKNKNQASKDNTQLFTTGRKLNYNNEGESFHHLSSIHPNDNSLYSNSLGMTFRHNEEQKVEQLQAGKNRKVQKNIPYKDDEEQKRRKIEALRNQLAFKIQENVEKSRPLNLRTLREQFNKSNMKTAYLPERPKSKMMMEEEGERMDETFQMNNNIPSNMLFQQPAPIIQLRDGEQNQQQIREEESDNNSMDF